MPIRPNFSLGNVVDPTRGAQAALSNVGTIMQQQADIKNERLKAEDRAARLVMLQDQAERQRVAADRETETYDLAQNQRQGAMLLGDMENPQNTVLTQQVDDKYTALIDQYKDQNLEGNAAYTKDLDALNTKLYSALGDGSQIDGTKVDMVLNRDPIAFKKQAFDKLIATGNFTPTEASAQVANEMARRYPVSSAEDRKMTQQSLDLALKQQMKSRGTGSGMTVNEDGTISIGAGNQKTVTSEGEAVEKINTMIDRIKSGRDISGWLGEKFLGNNKATRARLLEYVDIARKNKVPDHAILSELQTSVSDNVFLDDSIDMTSKEFVENAKKNAAKSQRTTTKGGGTAGYQADGTINGVSTDALIKQYLLDSRRNRNSGLRGTATAADLPEFFGTNTVAPKTDPLKDVGIDTTTTPKVTAAPVVVPKTVTGEQKTKVDMLDEEITALGDIDSTVKYDKKEKLVMKKNTIILANNLKASVNSGGIQKMSQANKENWIALYDGVKQGIVNTTELPGDILKFYLKNTKKLEGMMEGERAKLLRREQDALIPDTNPIAPPVNQGI
jgi:hypothetical protein